MLVDFNEIMGKVKALLRKAAERTVDRLWQTLGTLFDEIQSEECQNYFKNAGYASN